MTQFNWVPRPEVTGALALAKLAPVPWAGAAGEIGLLLLTGGAALLNRRKLKAAKLGLQAIVTGVEVYRRGKQGVPEAKEDDAALLEVLSMQQKALGIEAEIKAQADRLGRTKTTE